MPTLIAHTDGACSGNPGPGGWGVLMRALEGDKILKQRELSGGAELTTNNQMELMAAISALEALERSAEITIVTDSTYVKNGVTGWIHGWKKRGWKKGDKKPVVNKDLWQQLDQLNAVRDIRWEWVKGHAGDAGNEKADELARRGAESIR